MSGCESARPDGRRLRSFSKPVTAMVNGASRGIGLALVERLLADPAVERVFATAREGTRCEALRARGGGDEARLLALDMDVCEEASIAAAAQAVSKRAARIDLLVHCSGLLHDGTALQPERRLADVIPANMARSFRVNAIGPLLVAKHFQGLFPSRGRCILANLSARVGSIGDNRLGGWYGYRASKAAQNMITRNLSIEMRRRAREIICVALHPGTVDTRLSRPFQGSVPAGGLFSPERAARQLLAVIDALGPHDNGAFLAWDAEPIPW